MSNQPTTLAIADPPAVANLMNAGRFNQMMMIAQTMATAALIPEHLLGRKKGGTLEYFTADEIRANCFLIVNQAFRWGMDPFAVMPETYVVGGKLGYQGKLVAAVVNGLANLEERLTYKFDGQPGSDDYTITVSGKIRGESEPRTVSVRVGSVKTDNSMWKKDPEQKLVYTGATKWARRHCPEIILGILTDDDLDLAEPRQTTGRVVSQAENPYGPAENIEAAKPEKSAAKPAKAKPEPTATAPAPAAESAPVEIVQDAETDGVERPSVTDMVDDIRSACAERNISTGEATRRYRAAGLIPTGKKFADLTDDELFEVWKVRCDALDEQAPTEGGAK